MCKCDNNVEEALQYFCDMFANNECDHKLMDEMKKILISCRNEWQTYHLTEQQINAIFGNQFINKSSSSSQFYNKLFASLSPQYQYKLLRRVADKTDDTIILIDLLLFILKKFPESVSENGLKLIEIMDENEIKLNNSFNDSNDKNDLNLINYMRKKLVFDVLPIIFAPKSNLVLKFELTQKLMQKSLKFFVEQVIRTEINNNNDMTISNANNISNNKENADLLENKIIEIFQLIGLKNEWQLFNCIDFKNERKLDLIYEKISHFIDDFRYSGDTDSPIDLSSASTAMISGDEQTNQQILYATLLLFLQCLRRYSKLSNDIVLIEQMNTSFNENKLTISVNKKRKMQLIEPQLITESTELRQVFVVASKALKLLQENLTINKGIDYSLKILKILTIFCFIIEFSIISESIGLDKCRSYRSFLIDSCIYRADYNQVVESLVRKKSINLKSNLQLISVSSMLHDYNQTLKYCLDSIEILPLKHSTSTKETQYPKGTQESSNCTRILFFLRLNVDDIMRYIIQMIILCLKDRVILSLKPSDLGIGHLIVLSQYLWPNQIELFLTCMSCIRNGAKVHTLQSQPKFVYQYFFNYIFIPDIIEEFMSIVEMKDILLELKPSNATLGAPIKTSSKIITTRGVNKGAKEEIRGLLVQQMKVSKTQIQNELFIDFINKEIRSFLASIHK
jgi:hypothetical protein